MINQLLQSVGLRITGISTGNINRLLRTLPPSTANHDFCTKAEAIGDENQPCSDMTNPFIEEKPKCLLCKNNVPVTYKNVQLLSQFISPNTGHIYGQHITKLCRQQQKRVAKEIRRARSMGFMPVMYRDTIFLKDPDLFSSHYTGNVNIGDAVRLEPRERYEVPGQKKKVERKSKKPIESKKVKKK